MGSSEDSRDKRRSFWPALLIGIGVMAAVDEIIFHQVLGWHHFYDRATPLMGLVSDGFLHAAELIALVAGFVLFARVYRDRVLSVYHAWSGFLIGAGGFQLFDGIIDHKVLRVHQIRYGVENLLLYDLLWNGFAITLLIIGSFLLVYAKRQKALGRG